MFPLATVLVLLAVDVHVVPTDSALRLIRERGSIKLIFRNPSAVAWQDLRLAVESEHPLAVEVHPERIRFCRPADRCVFAIVARATPSTPKKRFPIAVRLSSQKRPELYVMQLVVDASPRAARWERGWMDAGTIRVTSRGPMSRLVVLGLLSAIPVALLLGLGWYFKRRAKRGSDAPR